MVGSLSHQSKKSVLVDQFASARGKYYLFYSPATGSLLQQSKSLCPLISAPPLEKNIAFLILQQPACFRSSLKACAHWSVRLRWRKISPFWSSSGRLAFALVQKPVLVDQFTSTREKYYLFDPPTVSSLSQQSKSLCSLISPPPLKWNISILTTILSTNASLGVLYYLVFLKLDRLTCLYHHITHS